MLNAPLSSPRHRIAHWLVATVIFISFFFGCLRATHMPLAGDELYTYYSVHQPSLAQVLHFQISTPIMLEPPLFELLTHITASCFHYSPLSLRIPSLLCFAFAQLLLYLILRPLAGTRSALLAVLLLYLLPLSNYAWQFRPYALLMAAALSAIFCWQRAASDQHHRTLAAIGLALSLALCINSHFYGVLCLLPVTLAELHLTLATRRVCKPILFALFTGALSILATLPFMPAAEPFREHYYRDPSLGLRSILEAYTGLLLPRGHLNSLLTRILHPAGRAALIALVLLAVFIFSYHRLKSINQLPQWTALATLSLLALPSVLIAYNFTHIFAPRHCVECAPSCIALICIAVSGPLQRMRTPALYLTGLLLAALLAHHCFAELRAVRRQQQQSQQMFASSTQLAASLQPGQAVYTTNDLCLALSLNGDPALLPHLRCLYSSADELRYSRQQSVYLIEMSLSHHTSLPTQFADYDDLRQHPALLLYADLPWEQWIPAAIAADGISTQLIAQPAQLGNLYRISPPN